MTTGPAGLTLLTRPRCHLCEAMKRVVDQASRQVPLAVTEVDVSTRPDLEPVYGDQVPVLLHGDRPIARTRVSVTDLVARLREAPPTGA